MKGVLKIGAFLVVLVVLIGGGWYVTKNSHSITEGSDSNFNKALDIMKSLQSSVIGGSLTTDQLDVLEKGYVDATDRLPKITAFRQSDRDSLTTLLTNNNIT
mgnify:CR=1 FL=1